MVVHSSAARSYSPPGDFAAALQAKEGLRIRPEQGGPPANRHSSEYVGTGPDRSLKIRWQVFSFPRGFALSKELRFLFVFILLVVVILG